MLPPSERRPRTNLDINDRTARHYVEQAGMRLGPDGRLGLNPLYDKAKEFLAPRLFQAGTVFKRLIRPRR